MGKSQDHRSNALAFAGLIVLLAFNILGYFDHIFPAWPWIVIAIAGSIGFAIVNFMNTVEENFAWKSYGAMAMILVTAAIYCAPIGKAYIHQP